jgi:ATP-dependent DNA helicase RecQ
LSDTEVLSLDLFRKLGSIDEVAKERGLKRTTITGHLAQAVRLGEVTVREVTGLDDQELAAIRTTFEKMKNNGVITLKPVFEALGGKYDYGVLKCVRVGMGEDEG